MKPSTETDVPVHPSPREFRKRFPIFGEKVFLNSCSKGALSHEVERAYGTYLESWRTKGSPWEEWVGVLESTRQAFASLVGCDSDEVAVTFCASTAAASVASALSFADGRDRILAGDFEFPTMSHNWRAQTRRGARIERIRSQTVADGSSWSGERISVAAYERKIEELGDRVALVPVESVCFRNGQRQDVASVVHAARAVGAFSLVDDYQSTGTAPLNVKELRCDVLITGALKYLLGSSGLAWLYVRRERIAELEPLGTGWFGQERPFDFDVARATYHASARRFETGTPPIPNLYAARSGLELVREIGMEAIGSHVESLASRTIEKARERGLRVLTPLEPSSRGPLVVLGAKNAEHVASALARESIVVSARGDGLRISFHYYNLSEDIDALFSALDRLEAAGALMERVEHGQQTAR
jgi:selenocysteine lyase/cysteine desulfurase